MAFSKITDEQVAELRSRIGKPITRVTEPFYREVNVDAARNYAHAIGDNNPLWLDREYAARTRWGGLLAPPTVLYSTENTVSGAVEGLAGVHAMFAGTDWRWFEPIRVGTVMRTVSTLKDMVEHKTRFAGRSFQQIYHVQFFDQHDTKLAEAALAGKPLKQTVWGGIREGMNDLVNVNPVIPETARKIVAAKKAEIAGGMQVFTGPIMGQDGSIKVAAGKSLTDKEIDSINWYVEGVEGQLPGQK